MCIWIVIPADDRLYHRTDLVIVPILLRRFSIIDAAAIRRRRGLGTERGTYRIGKNVF